MNDSEVPSGVIQEKGRQMVHPDYLLAHIETRVPHKPLFSTAKLLLSLSSSYNLKVEAESLLTRFDVSDQMMIHIIRIGGSIWIFGCIRYK